MPRNNDPIFWPCDEEAISLRQTIQKNYSDSINILQTQWWYADLDQRFSLGDQDAWSLIFPSSPSGRSKTWNFNLLQRLISMPSGFQRRNRKACITVPIHNGLQKTSDLLTKCLYYGFDKANAYSIYSDAFEKGALTQGIGFISFYLNDKEDPISPDIGMRYLDFKSVLIDPFYRQKDLSDCRYIWTRQFMSRLEAAAMYKKFQDKILDMPRGNYRDDKFYFMPEVYNIQAPDLMAVDEYWYLSTREATYLVDKETEECQEFEGSDEDLRELMQIFKGRIAVVNKSRPTTRRALLINDKVMVDEPNPYGLDEYPYVGVYGFFNPDTEYYSLKYRGLVRDCISAQYLFNLRKATDLDILQSQQMGLKIKKGALVTPDDSLNQGNGRVLWIDPKANMEDVQAMDIRPPSPVMLQMEEMLKNIMMEITGINEELLGSAIDDKAAILSVVRQGAGLTTLQVFFDQLDESLERGGSIFCKMIQRNWTYGKVKQVCGEEPTAEFDNKAFFNYGCKVVQGNMTESQQQLEVQQLINIKEMGAPIEWSDILPKMTIQNKDELLQKIAEREKAQSEQAQQMQQLQMQQLQVDNETKLSYAESQKSLAEERLAKIETDKALNQERISRSSEERTGSLLNLIKSVKELQSIDIENLARELEMLGNLDASLRAANPTPQAPTNNSPSEV